MRRARLVMRRMPGPSFVLAMLAAACGAKTPVGALGLDGGAPDSMVDSVGTADTGAGTGGLGGSGAREAGTGGAGGTTAPDAGPADANTSSDTTAGLGPDAAVDVPLPAPDAPRAPGPCEGGFLQWARGTSGSGEATVGGVAVSPDGTAWMTGEFRGTVTFWAGQPGETTRTASGGDFYLLKISRDGALLRFITATDTCGATDGHGGMVGSGLAALPDGSVLVTGGFSKEIRIGSTTLSAGGSREMFLARYHADGTPLWAVGTSGPCSPTQVGCGTSDPACRYSAWGQRVAVLPDGRSRVLEAGALAAYSAAGALEWRQSVWLTPDGMLVNLLTPHGLAVLADGSSFVVRDFIIRNTGPEDGQLARFSGDGKLLWNRRVGEDSMVNYAARSVLAFADGSAIVGGSFRGGLGAHVPYLARYEANGDLAWFRGIPASLVQGQSIPSAYGPSVASLVAFPSGGFVLVGTRMRAADTTGEGVCGRMVTGESLLLARYNAAGAIMWAKIEGGSYDLDHGPEAATFADGTSLVAAQFYRSLTLGRGEPNQTTLSAPDGGPHAFVARFGP